MRVQARDQGRHLAQPPPYGYGLVDAGPRPNAAHARWERVSADSKHPDGLGNNSGQLGRHYMTKMFAHVNGDSDTALVWGVATSVAPAASLDAAVDDLVGRLTAGAPVAVQLAKQLIDAAADGAPSRVLEALAGGLSSATEDLKEGVAAFQGRRDPAFRGR
jgi:hypothetical protein